MDCELFRTFMQSCRLAKMIEIPLVEAGLDHLHACRDCRKWDKKYGSKATNVQTWISLGNEIFVSNDSATS
jgi:predicted anti-sigma-YlaC factor YlaD